MIARVIRNLIRVMTQNQTPEHDRLFRKACELIKGEIQLHGQPALSEPSWLLTRRLTRAIGLFKRVLEINPDNWSAMWLVGKVYQRFRNTQEALSWFDRSSRINPSQPDVLREASICSMEIGRNDVAIAFALRAAQLDPSDSGLHANLALAYLLAGRVIDAQTTISQVLVGDPSDSISQSIQSIVQHFVSSGRVPPTTTPGLLNYWHKNLKYPA
jgi:tetratricopeptide (TPR) repeat protein